MASACLIKKKSFNFSVASSIVKSLAEYGHFVSIMNVCLSLQTIASGVAPKNGSLGFTINPAS